MNYELLFQCAWLLSIIYTIYYYDSKKKTSNGTKFLPGRRTKIEGINYLFLAQGISGLFYTSKKKKKPAEYEPEYILPSRKKMFIDLKNSTIATV